MGLYNVVEPCVVGKLHYARPTAQPIEVDDAEAGPLVDAGSLTPYQPGAVVSEHPLGWPDDAQPPTDGPYAIPGDTGTVLDGAVNVVEPDEKPAEPPAPRPRNRRRSTED